MNERTIVGTYVVRGHYGNYKVKVAKWEDPKMTWYFPLTPCCDATGKGMCGGDGYDGYTGCRACYHEVDGIFGNGWYSEELWQKALADREVVPVA
jgi:hypothetical protein